MVFSRFRLSPTLAAGLVCLLIALLLSGCATFSDYQTAQEYSREQIGVLTPGHSLGQTFISQRSGLNSLTIWVAPVSGEGGSGNPILTVSLFHAPQDTQPLNVNQISISGSGPVTVNFAPLPDSRGQPYFFRLETPGGSIQVFGSETGGYAQGQAYSDATPLQADLAFTTTYNYTPPAMFSDLLGLMPSLWLIFPLGLVLLIPGWLLLDLSGQARRFDFSAQIGLSLGLSLAVIPLLLLWTSTLGLHWSRTWVLFAAGLLSALMVWRVGLRLLHPASKHQPNRRWLLHLGIAGLFLGALLLRLAMVRDYAAPAWVDSVHHALITRLILQNGAFPSSYAPYFSVTPTEYHAGFHATLAAFLWLSGLSLPAGMLLYGQVLNAFTVYAVYLLGVTLTRKRSAAAWAALIAAFFTPMPAYYASWGRYTELAGLLMLPAAFAVIRPIYGWMQTQAASTPRPSWLRGNLPFIGLGIVLCGGLALVHYRVAAFLAALFIADGVFLLVARLRRGWRPWLVNAEQMAFGLGLPALGALLLTLPWMLPNLLTVAGPVLSASGYPETAFFSDFSWRYLLPALGQASLYLAGAGLLASLLMRRTFGLALALWAGLLFFLANLGAMHLPGGWFINNTSVEISLFLPLAVLGGYLISLVFRLLRQVSPKALHQPLLVAAFVFGVGLTGFGSSRLLPLLNPVTVLYRPADSAAMAWIDQNIPPQETILINPFNWGYGVYAGADGGSWIPPLTGRNTLPPPVLYGFGDLAGRTRINTISQAVIDHGADPAYLGPYLFEQGIHYVYVGVKGGPLDPGALQKSPYFQTLYQAGGAWVFEIKP